ncbi:hypothetical protein [Bosea sp. 117]|uniref:hypothetical protein n=1 Tax=Bosea sp. 117 TaxID=1125973 RepID=UPI000494A7F9|nr:hypothetical protein [Bosea sp. 117]
MLPEAEDSEACLYNPQKRLVEMLKAFERKLAVEDRATYAAALSRMNDTLRGEGSAALWSNWASMRIVKLVSSIWHSRRTCPRCGCKSNAWSVTGKPPAAGKLEMIDRIAAEQAITALFTQYETQVSVSDHKVMQALSDGKLYELFVLAEVVSVLVIG